MLGLRTISRRNQSQVRFFCNSVLENGIKKITMTSPKTRNSLSLDLMKKLQTEIKVDKNNLDLRCIVISGEGPAFSSGHNLKEMTYKEGFYRTAESFPWNCCCQLSFNGYFLW